VLTALLALASALVPAATGQSARPAANPQQPGEQTLVTVSEPLSISALGLDLLLPEGAVADIDTISGGRARAAITPADSTWVLQVFNAVSSNDNLTIDEILDGFERQRRGAVDMVNPGTGRRVQMRVFDRKGPDELIVADNRAGRFYCSFPEVVNELVTGYTVFRTKPGRFIVMQLDAKPEHFERARIVYETIVASAEFEDPAEASAEQGAALLAGEAFLARQTPETMEAALVEWPAFHRLFRPAPGGADADAEEIAFQKIDVRLGQLGELNGGSDRTRWTAAQREFGYVMQVDARALDGSRTFDSKALYFLSRDRTREFWSITNQISQGDQTFTTVTTVVRRGSRLTVQTKPDGAPEAVRDFDLKERLKFYLSPIEKQLLSRLVAQQTEPGQKVSLDLGFVHYDAQRESLHIRRDQFSNLELDRGWTYISTPAKNAEEVTSTLRRDGTLIRRELAGGVIIERTEQARLIELWRQKGLLDR
jgi:hypothetical protein